MNKSTKPNIVKINLSTPVLTKTRCSFCYGLPYTYYAISNGPLEISPQDIRSIFERYKSEIVTSFNTSYYLKYKPKYFTGMSDFSHKTIYKNFNPRLHKALKSKIHSFSNVSEFLSCECGRSSWSFTFKSIIGRDDIINRKSSKFFDLILTIGR